MTYYDTKQAAIDPDNPAANEQIPFSEWNAMVSDIRRKIHEITVDITALGNDKIIVYKTASTSFVMESLSVIAVLADLADVTISGVPADNEMLAYDSVSSNWINQTAAEAGLATVAGLAAYYPLAGATMTGNMDMGDYQISGLKILKAYDSGGVALYDNLGNTMAFFGGSHAFSVHGGDMSMVTNQIKYLGDPTSAQDASTKNYADTRLFTKEAVTSFLDGYIPVYRTSSGKFEMEEGGGSAGFPVVDSTALVKGSADGTKLMRFEVDGITTGTTRVMTVPDKNITLCDTTEVMLLSGVYAMAADIDMGGHYIDNCGSVTGRSDSESLDMVGGLSTGKGGRIVLNGDGVILYPGRITLSTPNAAKTDVVDVAYCEGVSDTPLLGVKHGLDMNAKSIDDIGGLILNSATELTIASGVVTAAQSYHIIDTEGDAASDDLTTISGGATGQVLIIGAANDARTVVVKTGGSIALAGADFSLDNVLDTLTLMCITAGYWKEISRSDNGA